MSDIGGTIRSAVRRHPRATLAVGGVVLVGGVVTVVVLGGAGKEEGQHPTASAAVGACVKPSAANTGTSGPLKPIQGDVTLKSGDTLSDAEVSGGIAIEGSGVTVHNVKVAGNVFAALSQDVVIDHVRANAIAISSSARVTIRFSDISGNDDGIHVTSDRGSMNTDITVENNYIHDPHGLAADAHYDGVQVRGVKSMKLTCNNLDAGRYLHQFNAAIYLENANGGDHTVTIADNWLNGWGYTMMLDASNTRLSGNRFGRNAHWGLCDTRSNAGGARTVTGSGNVWDDTGAALSPCGRP